jgi:hypothetical protein
MKKIGRTSLALFATGAYQQWRCKLENIVGVITAQGVNNPVEIRRPAVDMNICPVRWRRRCGEPRDRATLPEVEAL